jgi:hypothetical protein
MPLVIAGNSSGSTTVQATDAVTATITLPSATDTLVGKATTDTLTNKTLTLPVVGTTIGVGGATPSASGAGITFPATQSASTNDNTLDDYEEGTWTPTITFSGGNGNLAYATRVGTYTKIGRCVSFTMHLVFGETTAAGYLASISGLPFAAGSIRAGGGAYIDNFSLLAGGPQWVFTDPTSSTIVVYMSGTGTATVIGVASVPAANATIIISGTYFTS